LLLAHVSGAEPEMPKDGKPLVAGEVEALRQWLLAGAPWPEGLLLSDKSLADANWWSLLPIRRPALPYVRSGDSSAAHTPIDLFILAKQAEQHLEMSPEADRRTLIRRLYFDLIGMPPTPEEIAAFVADESPTAYEQLVERLLASPHYGERWARHWLDVVKYADTCGYDKDKLRPNAWPYRDYVIRAFNDDKPYTRFVEEQMAGDVLFPGEPDGILGLGFIAAGPWDFIGHVEVPETKIDGQIARNIDRDEMVTNTLNTFCSVTIQCARCHNHKFDPITQQHYYRLQAVFAAVDRAERAYDLDPEMERKRQELDQRLREMRLELTRIDEAIKAEGGAELADFDQRIAELKPRTEPRDKHPAYGYHSSIEPTPDQVKWVRIDLGRQVNATRIVLYPCHDEFAGIGAGFGFPVRFQVVAAVSDAADQLRSEEWKLLADRTLHDVANPGTAAYVIDASGEAVRHVRITATKLAQRQNDFIFALAELAVFDADGHNVALQAPVISLDSIEAPVRWSRSNLTDGIWPAAAEPAAARELAAVQAAREKLLARINTPERMATREQLGQQIALAEQQLAALPSGRLVYAAATRFTPQGSFQPTRGQPRTIRLLHRGDVLQPRDEMHPGTLPLPGLSGNEFILPPDHTEGDRRAALARWLTRHDQPLTWRSIVNRLWLYHFGQGLVATPNDFGRMGQPPSHPELLDWLADEFRQQGGSIKELQRMIVTSRVYRQASESSQAGAASQSDAENRYLWRANRRRLEAEEVRDAVLAVSGRLRHEHGGPGFYLFVLEKTDHSPHYEYHKFDPEDPATHRRSVYRFIVRSQPDPFMTTLDCADSSQSTPQRNETVTSLQALSLLNNKFNLALSRHFAQRLAAERSTLAEQIARAMQLTCGREPTAREQAEMEAYAREHGLPNLCRVLFNLSEFVYVD